MTNFAYYAKIQKERIIKRFGGLLPLLKVKGVIAMVSFDTLFQFVIMLTGIITLVYAVCKDLFNKKLFSFIKKITAPASNRAVIFT